MISVLILTKDEECNLPACLASLDWSDDIVVYDSLSTDGTAALARARGCRVVSRAFDDWATHQNWAVTRIAFKHPWVYYSDADEIVTPALRDEMLAAVADPARDAVAYRIRRKDYFMERWIRHACLYPTWFVRLFRPDRIRWHRRVHPLPKIDGPVGELAGHFLNYPFSKGLEEWREKHRGFAALEAVENADLTGRSIDWGGLRPGADSVRRRKALKDISYRLPMRPQLRFLYMYLWRRGFLDGAAGYRFCRLIAWYEACIDANIRRLRAERRNQEV